MHRALFPSLSTSTAVKSRLLLTAAPIPGGRITANTAASITRLMPNASNAAVFEYPNSQQAATIWYHDHALGMTRLNVVGGMAGFYLIRDNKDKVESNLPKGKYEIPLAIQDRVFNTDGTFNFPIDPSDPRMSIPTGDRSSSVIPSW